MRLQLLPILAAAFAVGIAVSGGALLPAGPLLAAVILGAAAVAAALHAAPRWTLVMLAGWAFSLGAFSEAHDRRAHPNVWTPWLGKRVQIEGLVLEEPRRSASGEWIYRVEVDTLRWQGTGQPLHARLLLPAGASIRLRPGERVRAAGFLRPIRGRVNFGTFDYRRYAARQHLYASLAAQDRFIERVGTARLRLDRHLALALRARMVETHYRHLPEEYAALLNSLVFGARATPVSEAVERDFRNAGAVHVLVASGTQVTFCVGTLWLMLRYLFLPRWAIVLATLGCAWGYGLMAGGGPSIARAGIMAVVLATAGALGRQSEPRTLLATAALGILWLEPGALFDAGFHLSFAAVWGLITLLPWLQTRLPARPRPLWTLVAASLAAQLATAPVTAYHFCQVTPIGLVSNLIAVPAALFLLWGGIVASLVALLFPALGGPADTINLGLLFFLRGAMHACARVPGGHPWVVPPSAAGVALCFALLAALPQLRRAHLTRPRCRVGAVVLLLVAAWGWLPRRSPLRVTFLDVGQGDSILVQSPAGRCLLVDGGGIPDATSDFGETVLLPALLHRGVRRLDYVVVTHAHADHAGGLAAVCRDLRVGALIETGTTAPTPELRRLREHADRRGVPRLLARADATWQLDKWTRITLLHPRGVPTGGERDENRNSVVLRIDDGQTSFLLTGDIDQTVEEALVTANAPLGATVLKVAHHGSAGASSERFLERVAPRVAVVSVGRENVYGLPAPAALRRLQAGSARLFRTDEEGAVEVCAAGRALTVRGARRPRARWRMATAGNTASP